VGIPGISGNAQAIYGILEFFLQTFNSGINIVNMFEIPIFPYFYKF